MVSPINDGRVWCERCWVRHLPNVHRLTPIHEQGQAPKLHEGDGAAPGYQPDPKPRCTVCRQRPGYHLHKPAIECEVSAGMPCRAPQDHHEYNPDVPSYHRVTATLLWRRPDGKKLGIFVESEDDEPGSAAIAVRKGLRKLVEWAEDDIQPTEEQTKEAPRG